MDDVTGPLDTVLRLKREKAERDLVGIERAMKRHEQAVAVARDKLSALSASCDFAKVRFANTHGYLAATLGELDRAEDALGKERSRLDRARRNLGRALLAEERLGPTARTVSK